MSLWETTVNELMEIFHQALLAMIPIAEKARMPWKEPDTYDDWDEICEVIYKSIIIQSIRNDDKNIKLQPILKYDARVDDYSQLSFITKEQSSEYLAFVCFETSQAPFDVCLFAVLDAQGKVTGQQRYPLSATKFLFAGRNSHGIMLADTLSIRL